MDWFRSQSFPAHLSISAMQITSAVRLNSLSHRIVLEPNKATRQAMNRSIGTAVNPSESKNKVKQKPSRKLILTTKVQRYGLKRV